MDIIILLAILISGTVFGSFFTLAVWRIPRHEDITHVRSYCPKCNHRLEFLDLIPVLSYIFLGGKCRYCKDKIRPRYLILEVFSGLVFLLVAISHGIGVESSLYEFLNLGFIFLFLCGVFISGGIDKENLIIPNGVMIYEACIGVLFLGFKLFYNESVMTNVIGFIAIPLLLFVTNLLLKFFVKDDDKLPFGMGDIKYIAVIGLFLGFSAQVLSLVLAIFVTGFYIIFKKVRGEIPFGYYLSIATALVIILIPHLSETLTVIELIVS